MNEDTSLEGQLGTKPIPQPSVYIQDKSDVVIAKKKHVALYSVVVFIIAGLIGGVLGYTISHNHEEGIIKADNAAITKLTNDGYTLSTELQDSKVRLKANQDFLTTHYVDSHGDWREKKHK